MASVDSSRSKVFHEDEFIASISRVLSHCGFAQFNIVKNGSKFLTRCSEGYDFKLYARPLAGEPKSALKEAVEIIEEKSAELAVSCLLPDFPSSNLQIFLNRPVVFAQSISEVCGKEAEYGKMHPPRTELNVVELRCLELMKNGKLEVSTPSKFRSLKIFNATCRLLEVCGLDVRSEEHDLPILLNLDENDGRRDNFIDAKTKKDVFESTTKPEPKDKYHCASASLGKVQSKCSDESQADLILYVTSHWNQQATNEFVNSQSDSSARCLKVMHSGAEGLSLAEYLQSREENLVHCFRSKAEDGKGVNEVQRSQTLQGGITFEMLSPACSTVVNLAKCCSFKDAIFVMYNYSRLSTLLARFKSCGQYPDIPDLRDVDFSELKEEEEWQLVMNGLVEYPLVLSRCVRQFEKNGKIGIHLLCNFLKDVSRMVSCYYRRVHILVEPRPHLLPRLMARICLLRALRQVFLNAFHVLDISPPDAM